MNFADTPVDGRIECFALVKRSEVKTSSKGSLYLDIDLADKSGTINGKYWNYQQGATPKFEPNSVVKVRGSINEYRGTKQLRIELIRPALNTDNVDPSEYVASASYEGEDMYNEITDIVRHFEDDDLRSLVLAVYDKYKKQLLVHPAAVRLHHAIRGGLLFHTLSIIRMCQSVAKEYPSIDEDLLIAGAALHDIGKLVEIESSSLGVPTQYSAEGNLLGHLVRGAMMVRETAQEIGTPEDKLVLVEHMLISHHGKPEYGAAIPPKFLEAIVLAKLDELDAVIYEVEDTIQNVAVGEFSNAVWALDNTRLYNTGRKTVSTDADLLED